MLITSGKLKRAIVAVLAITALVVILSDKSQAGDSDNIAFSDDALKHALLTLPGADINADGELTEGELAALTGQLDIIGLEITDITGMQFADGLSGLDISGNKIRDISCLTSLVASDPHALSELDVSDNYLDITEGSDDMAVIDELISSGCAVTYEPQKTIKVDTIAFDIASLEMCPGDSVTISASVSPSDAADKTVIWSSDNEASATVTDGEVTAVAEGSANITAKTQDGGFEAVCTVIVKRGNLSSSYYAISDGYINVPKACIVDVFKSCFSNNYGDICVLKSNGEATSKGVIGTGMTVKLIIGGVPRDEAKIVVSGDVNGDGFIDILDFTLIRRHILELMPLSDDYIKASDVDSSGATDILDYTLIRRDMLDLSRINNVLPDLPEVTDPRIRKFLDIALAQQGKPYVFGAEGSDSYDCSGFIYYCLNQAGYSVGRSTADTYSRKVQWQYVDRDDLQPGDLMFYLSDDPEDGDHIGHIGIYLGNGYHIHASSDYMHIVICRVNGWYDDTLSHGRRVFY